jgi:2-polyprenyl-3-methyl-5-hydroxy-6-metoxy-1,4-benzoquinol methylase
MDTDGMGKIQPIVIDHCPACGGHQTEEAYCPDDEAWDRFRELSRRKYQGYMDQWGEILDLKILRCGKCKHLWHHIQPDQASLIGMYNSSLPLSGKRQNQMPNPQMHKKMKALYRLVNGAGIRNPRLLDYGSGFGSWAQSATDAGFTVVAYEPSSERAVKNNNSITFQVITDYDTLKNEKFDAIIMVQVLEHTQNPLAILRGLKVFCHAYTMIYITVPNIDRYARKIWTGFPFDGRRMHILSPFEHLQGFNPDSLDLLLRRAGMKRINHKKVWYTHPEYALRQVFGKFIPRFRKTMALAKISDDRGKRLTV